MENDNVVMVEGATGMVMEVVTKEEPVRCVPMNNMLPESEFGAMYYDWD